MAFLHLLADSVVVPSSRPSLFLPLFLLIAFLNGALLLWNCLGVKPLSAAAAAASHKLAGIDPKTEAYSIQLKAFLPVFAEFAAVCFIYFFVSLVVSIVLPIITFFSAVDAFRARELEDTSTITLHAVIRRAVGNLKGPVLTQLLGYLFLFGSVFIFIFPGVLLNAASGSSWRSPVVVVFLTAVLLFVYLHFVFSVSTVVSIDRADVFGYAAISWACDLVRRNNRLGLAVVVLFAAESSILIFLYTKIAAAVAPSNVAQLSVLMLVSAAAKVVSATAIVAYYRVCNSRAKEAGELYLSLPPPAKV